MTPEESDERVKEWGKQVKKKLVADAVAEEREACARVVDEVEAQCDGPCECPVHGKAAAAIRARKGS